MQQLFWIVFFAFISLQASDAACVSCHKSYVDRHASAHISVQTEKIQNALWAFGGLNGYEHNVATNVVHENRTLLEEVSSKKYREIIEEIRLENPQLIVAKTTPLASAPTAEDVKNDTSKAALTYIRHNKKLAMTPSCTDCHDVTMNTMQTMHTKVKTTNRYYEQMHQTISDAYHGKMQQPNGLTTHLASDVHLQAGMQCADCHTTLDVHGDGLVRATSQMSVEIECQDCHGTTKAYPWELPLGFSDHEQEGFKARGTVASLQAYLENNQTASNTYLLSARGNALPNVTKRSNNSVNVRLQNGKEITLKPLKLLKRRGELSKRALVAMDNVDGHNQKLECYSCHASWAPQYYGKYVTVDYRHTGIDQWNNQIITGKVSTKFADTRFENPVIARNGEGRIAPFVPSEQVVATIIMADGDVMLKDHIFSVENVEGAGLEGQKAISMQATNPHTTTKESRSCESCHTNQTTMGYGVNSTVKSDHVDFMQLISTDGEQLQSVGTHYKSSAPLSSEQLQYVQRQDSCVACHVEIPHGDLAVDIMTHMVDTSGIVMDNDLHNSELNFILRLGAWVKILVGAFIIALIAYWYYSAKKSQGRRWS
jgi:nitrate/TMAO reductase-like tetraheme cytochrome c subunit